MRLVSFRVTNFRSIQDSGSIAVGDSLCLVGKNEAGKTAVLNALAALNPHPSTPMILDVERDYPRHKLTEYQKVAAKEPAVVVTTAWELDEGDRTAIEEEFGAGSVRETPVTVLRKYGAVEPEWSWNFDFPIALKHLLATSGLSDFEQQPLSQAKTTTDLHKALSALQTPTAGQTALLQKLTAYPNQGMTGFANALVKTKLPHFMYFSHYDRMEGQLRLDTFTARRNGTAAPKVEPGEQVFVDFLDYAGTSIDEITKTTTYESLNARCEAASIRITQQLTEYWSQNPFLKIDVRVTKGETGDKPPFNDGIVARARVRNDLYGMTVPFSERSAGFIWFFSFIVKFAQVTKDGGALIILLDEPGLTLHGKAQEELLRYFAQEIEPSHQLLFTTHSPFMVPAERLDTVRIVEDRVTSPKPGKWVAEGTSVRSDSLAVDKDTLFPLQGALGYEITQSLFIGKNTLLVEGPGDILFLKALSSALERRKRPGLAPKWTLCPAGGLDKIQPFVSLFSGARLNLAVLTDFAKADQRKIDNLRKTNILEDARILTFASLLGSAEADVEDIFDAELYARILNEAYSIPSDKTVTAAALVAAEGNTLRQVKQAEAVFRLMPESVAAFSHYTPAEWIFTHPEVLDETTSSVATTLDRAATVFAAIERIPTE